FFNAASFAAVLVSLLLIRGSELHPNPRGSVTESRVRDGLRYVRSTPTLLTILVIWAVVGTLAVEVPVSLPLVAEFAFHGGAGLFSAMMALFSVGGITGGILAARRHRPNGEAASFVVLVVVFGVTILLAALAPTVPLALVAMVPMGAASTASSIVGQS